MGAGILRALVVAAAISVVASIAVGTYLRGKQQCFCVKIVPDRRPSPDEIKEAVRILTERAEGYGEELGVARMSLSAAPDGVMSARLWAETEPTEFIRRFTQPGVVDLRLVAPKGAAGEEWERALWRQEYYSLREIGQTRRKVVELQVRRTPELRVTAFKSVSHRTEGLDAMPIVTLELFPGDAQVLNDVRRKNVGRELALMMDGEVLLSAVIADAIETNRIEVRGTPGIQETKRLAKTLGIGALPVNLSVKEVTWVR